MTVTSPCTGVCKLDAATGWCLGCGRDGPEIADWKTQPQEWRERVWKDIPQRLNQLGVTCQRLAWTTSQIHDFVVSSIDDNRGTWVMGVVGAVAEFTAPQNESSEVTSAGGIVTGHTRNGAIRMAIDDHIRALTFDPPSLETPARIVLAVKRERGRLPVADTLKELGEDTQQIIEPDGRQLYDLGLGRKEARFCVRVGTGAAQDALNSAIGLSFSSALSKIGSALVSESPTRVVETALGRIEVEGQIPPPTAKSPDGPHTHLLPDHLATNRAMPVGMELPRAYLPGAIFYPAR